MSLSSFLTGVGFPQDVVNESNALVHAVHCAKQDFGYQIGAASSDEGGSTGETRTGRHRNTSG